MTDYAGLVAKYATEAGIDPAWAVAEMMQESSGNPSATGQPTQYGRAAGLMQLIPPTAKAYGVTDPYNADQNARAGVQLLADNLKRYGGDMSKASAAYFAGTDPSKWGPGVARYVGQVAQKYNSLVGQYPMASEPPRVQAPSQPAPMSADAQAGASWLKSWASGTDQSAPPTQPQDQSPEVAAGAQWLDQWAQAAKPKGPTKTLLPNGITVPNLDVGKVADAAVQGAEEGFGKGPLLNTHMYSSPANAPEAYKIADAVGNYTVGPVVSLVGRGINALTGAIGGAVQSVGDQTGNGLLARDLRAMPQAFAGMPLEFAGYPTGNALTGATEATAGRNALDRGPMPPPRVEPPVTRAQAAAQPTAEAAPANLSAAATPQEVTAMTPQEAARMNAREGLQRLTNGAPAGEDVISYVPGSIPIKAEYSGDPNVATQHRAMLAANPDYRAEVTDRLAKNNEARKAYFEEIAGDPVATGHLQDQASQAFDEASKAAFANKTAANPQPIVDTIDGILKSPEGVRPAVKQKLEQIKSIITDPATGQPYTDPEMLYGARKAIGDMLSKQGIQADPINGVIRHQLDTVQSAIDQAIEPAAPGYSKALADYSAAKGPITAQEYLQANMPKIINSAGNMTPAAYRNFMKRTMDLRNAKGNNPAKALTDQDMTVLWNINSDLQRSTNMELGKGTGSDTAQKAATMANMAGHLGKAALRGKAAAATGGMSEFVVQPFSALMQSKRTNKLVQNLLEPPTGGQE